MFLGALTLLGGLASVFLIFSDSVQLIRIGLVAALWAAVLGALAATKYRKEAAVGQAKAGDLQKVYELQLDREVAARREYELETEAHIRAEVGADAAEIAALRAELTVLHQSLRQLFDGELPVDRPALRADATRVRQLPGRDSARAGGQDEQSAGVRPVYESDPHRGAMFASPDDDPVTAETAIVTASGSWADAFTEVPDESPGADLMGPPVPPVSVSESAAGSARRRWREAEPGEATQQLSVAEIMANIQSESAPRKQA